MNGGQITYVRLLGLALVTSVTAILTALTAIYLWKEWLLYAAFISGLFVFGGFRFFPWKTAISKAFSVGLSIGMLIPIIGFIRNL